MRAVVRQSDGWLRFEQPVEVLTARCCNEVVPCLERIAASGLWAVGWVAYEAAPAFDPALETRPCDGVPLLCFGLFDSAEKLSAIPPGGEVSTGEWTASIDRSAYREVIRRIRESIAAGETYQVNYTFRMQAPFSGDSFALFRILSGGQQGGHGAWIETDQMAVCSASPELFFEFSNGQIVSRPMKGTAPRGLIPADDRAAADALSRSVKNRAENIMITDMIRNDLGRIAVPGTVRTRALCAVEPYPTVWQMTSTVEATLREGPDAPLVRIFRALFPCASITGAPKVQTMGIIRDLEASVRGLYTGAIGMVAPDGAARFGVAIRTAVVDRVLGRAEYGTGGGIVWDSDADAEYDEALQKACILTRPFPEFSCLETMLYEPGRGIFLLDRHLRRLAESAGRFGFPLDADGLRHRLNALDSPRPLRVRLLLHPDGRATIETAEISGSGSAVVRLALARSPIDSRDLFLYHKTTCRAVYDNALAECPDADDVLLFNERGEVTESCTANVVAQINGHRVTPPVSCGLLAGTFRQELIDSGEISVQELKLDALRRAEEVWLINSVRKWRRAQLALNF